MDELELLALVEDEVVELLPVVVVEVIVPELVWVEVEVPVWAAIGVCGKTTTDPKTRMAITSSNVHRSLFIIFHRSHR